MNLDFVSYILLFGGLYCIYNFYKMRVQNDLSNSILLPKDVDPNKCKDKAMYIKKTSTPLLILGIAVCLHAGLDIYNSEVGGLESLTLFAYIAVFAILIWFFLIIRKCNKEYF